MAINYETLLYLAEIGNRFAKQTKTQELTQTIVAQHLTAIWRVEEDTCFEYLTRVNRGAVFAKLHPANAPRSNNKTRTPSSEHEQRVADYAAAIGVSDLEKFLHGLERELPQFTYRKGRIEAIEKKDELYKRVDAIHVTHRHS